jgi:CheY-like chemotaxis protein
MDDRKKRALVVDDEEALRAVMTEVLDMVNIETDTASSGEEAIAIAADPEKHFDILIIDMYMPLMTGDEVYEELKKYYPECPVLFISGLDRNPEQKGETDPKKQFLKKPFAVKDIQNAIKRLLNPLENKS